MRKILVILIVAISAILLLGACGGSEEFVKNDEGDILFTHSQFIDRLSDMKVSTVKITSEAYSLKGAEYFTGPAWINWAKESPDFQVSFIIGGEEASRTFGFDAESVSLSGVLKDGEEFIITDIEINQTAIVHARNEGFLIIPRLASDWQTYLASVYSKKPFYVDYSFVKISIGELDFTRLSEPRKRPGLGTKIGGSGFETDEEALSEKITPARAERAEPIRVTISGLRFETDEEEPAEKTTP